MYPFFSELPLPMNRVFTRLILDHLHTFSLLTLFMTVFGYHVQLTNSILKEKSEHRMYSLNFCQTFKPIIFMYCSNVRYVCTVPFFPYNSEIWVLQNIYQYSLHIMWIYFIFKYLTDMF